MMNGTRPKRTPSTAPARVVVDELEVLSKRAAARRKIFSTIVLAPLVVGLLATSVYSLFPPVPTGQSRPDGAAAPDAPAPDLAGQVAALESAVTKNPQDYAALVALGNAYFDQQRFADAEKTYKRALAIDGTSPDVRVDHGTTLFYQNRALEAVAEYQSALKARPDHINAKVNLGIALHSLGQPEKAAAQWSEALSLAGDPVQRQRIQDMISKAAKGG